MQRRLRAISCVLKRVRAATAVATCVTSSLVATRGRRGKNRVSPIERRGKRFATPLGRRSVSLIERCGKHLATPLGPGSTGVTDVAALAACANLHVLDLEGTGVMDVAALAACVNLHPRLLALGVPRERSLQRGGPARGPCEHKWA